MELSELSNYVIEGKQKDADQWTQKALAEGMDPQVIVTQGLAPGMAVVGDKFKNYEYYMPEVLVSARAMKASMAHLKPLLSESGGATAGHVVIGTVQGDLHDIGKNLVAMMLEGGGYEVTDLGTDVAPDKFVEAVEERKADILCLSALLTTTMPMMKTTIDTLREAELGQQVKVMVGGAPLTESYASQIGADGYAPEAASAVDRANELLGTKAG